MKDNAFSLDLIHQKQNINFYYNRVIIEVDEIFYFCKGNFPLLNGF